LNEAVLACLAVTAHIAANYFLAMNMAFLYIGKIGNKDPKSFATAEITTYLNNVTASYLPFECSIRPRRTAKILSQVRYRLLPSFPSISSFTKIVRNREEL
jgi:hypothetical protein